MTEPVFTPWPKIARFRRDVIISEKIDGTNCAIGIADDETVWTQSRNRIIPSDGNHFGFPQWVQENREGLVSTLGPGVHFGEWWGKKIARAYDQDERIFSLFNTSRWNEDNVKVVPGLSVVPVLYSGPLIGAGIYQSLWTLKMLGSQAAPGFMRPEGIVIFHTAADIMFKITIENDEKPKGKQP